MLLHLIDATADDPGAAWRTVRGELEAYGGGLDEKPEIVALSKVDTMSVEDADALAGMLSEEIGCPVRTVSAISGQGLDALLRLLHGQVRLAREARSLKAERGAQAESESPAWSPV